MKIRINYKKLLAIVLTLAILVLPNRAFVVIAETTSTTQETSIEAEPPEAPEAPTAPSAPEAPTTSTATAPTAPTPPTAPENNYVAPTPPTAPEAPEAPTAPTSPTSTSTQTSQTAPTGSSDATNSSSGNVGDTAVATGDANNNSNLLTTGNSNLAATGSGSGGSISVANVGNGADSTNSGSVGVVNNSDTNQTNNATVNNDLDQSAVTGGNSASFNTGNSSITTGDANTSATVVTSVNTNVDGVAVAEFNIADDHVGDIILDFISGCVSGCDSNITTLNSGNGAQSDNLANVDVENNKNVDQVNDALIGNELTLVADSGNNKTSFNTGGDSDISTGDANVSANVVTFANNNISGNIVYTVINIFGNLVGDIILTEEAMNAFCGNCLSGATASNTGNGAGSVNTADVNQTNNQDINQFNSANIDNNLVIHANTGDNDTNFNTGGGSTIQTGDSSVDVNVINIANTNITGGNFWLVIVNEAGRWIGRILGFDGSNMAGSEEIEFIVNDAGEIIATNNGNGAESTNSATVNQTSDTSINQENTANIENNINLTANTGGNTSSYNTGGNSNIQTGDATVIANIVNFVNNNIVGTGQLFVTVINVFGSWIGDFVGPGQEKVKAVAESSGSETTNSTVDGIGGVSDVWMERGNDNPGPEDEAFDTGILAAATVSSKALVAKVLGYRTESGQNEISEEKDDELLAQAGVNSMGQTASNNTISVNLAWLLFVLPIGVLFIIKRKRGYLFRKA